jgi:D-alanyl-D-alanine carboxypeptidase/D-alanyl-D-alanine-endopeptidase (penicillin-binding protein 4)
VRGTAVAGLVCGVRPAELRRRRRAGGLRRPAAVPALAAIAPRAGEGRRPERDHQRPAGACRGRGIPALRILAACGLVAALAAAGVAAADPAAPPDRDTLLFHVETFEGAVLASQGADTPFNPASLIKVGTSLWALERLGPEHRYRTAVGAAGEWDKKSGLLTGTLVVEGGGDPDFHAENVFLLARQLNLLLLTRVEGGLAIGGDLWVGWEHGAEKRVVEPRARAELMGRRLKMMLDPKRWDRSTRAAWQAVCARRGWDPAAPPRIEITGPVVVDAPPDWRLLAVHLSNPLPAMLRRFNVYSNNDIVRVADGLGGPAGLQAFLEQRLELPAGSIELETASGELHNRITARTGVRLMRAFIASAAARGLAPSDLLPVVGCDPGATSRKYPKLAASSFEGALAVKTGTLVQTDGGVAVLGGIYTSPELGRVLFCVASPSSGWREDHWRRVQQSWLLELTARTGGVVQRPCGPELPFCDTFAEVHWFGSARPLLAR